MSNADVRDDEKTAIGFSPARDDDRTVMSSNSIARAENVSNLGSQEFPQDPMIGRSLDGGRYKIVGVLGRGGMSIVYKAQQELVGRYVAIKTLTVQLLGDQTIVQRFTREVQTLGKLNHPNIVTAFDCVLDAHGQPYFIMDYLEGKSLAEVLEEEQYINQERAKRIAIEVCSAVASAHNNHIVHRDLKPANIMLINAGTVNEQVKIVDFGVAKIAEDVHKLTATGEIWGTPSYMSPEQAHGHCNDYRSDIYSVGCVIFEALSGKPPFKGQSTIETLMMHINNPIPSVSERAPDRNIHPAFEYIVLRALQKDPGQRFQSMKEMEEALLALNLKTPLTMSALDTPTPRTADYKLEPNVVQPTEAAPPSPFEHQTWSQPAAPAAPVAPIASVAPAAPQFAAQTAPQPNNQNQAHSYDQSQPSELNQSPPSNQYQSQPSTQNASPSALESIASQPIGPNSTRANESVKQFVGNSGGHSNLAIAIVTVSAIVAIVLIAVTSIIFKPSLPASQPTPPAMVQPTRLTQPASLNNQGTTINSGRSETKTEAINNHHTGDLQASQTNPDSQISQRTPTVHKKIPPTKIDVLVHKSTPAPIHLIKKLKKQPTRQSGESQQLKPVDDFDRWNQFNNGH